MMRKALGDFEKRGGRLNSCEIILAAGSRVSGGGTTILGKTCWESAAGERWWWLSKGASACRGGGKWWLLGTFGRQN